MTGRDYDLDVPGTEQLIDGIYHLVNTLNMTDISSSRTQPRCRTSRKVRHRLDSNADGMRLGSRTVVTLEEMVSTVSPLAICMRFLVRREHTRCRMDNSL